MNKLSKFLYFKRKSKFLLEVNNFPIELNPLCFIEDTNEIWFNNHFFLAGHDSLNVSEMDNNVIVSLSDSHFTLIPGSSSINIKALGNNILISSSALTRIDTDDSLEWKNNKLYHKDSGVILGTYGPNADLEGANYFSIPKITFNSKGHATEVLNKLIKIRDYTELRKSDELNYDRPILLSERGNDLDDTNITRKGKNISYNNFTQTLTVPNVQINGLTGVRIYRGNLVVELGTIIGKLQGEVTGSATPKIHASDKPDYGGASLNLYGHVKLVDEMPANPTPSSDNTNVSDLQVDAKAASPYLVYNYVQASKIKVNAINANKLTVDLSSRVDFTDDFVAKDNKLYINWLEL